MERHIEAIQECLQTAQDRLSATEDAVVDLHDEPTVEQCGKIRNTITETIKALQRGSERLLRAEVSINAGAK
jgi:hypothetical protein